MGIRPKRVKSFNIGGPCDPQKCYMVSPLPRPPEALKLITENKYFVIHAPRQSGKTTLLQFIVNALNESKEFYALYCSLESISGFTLPEIGIPKIVNQINKYMSNSPSLSHLVSQSSENIDTCIFFCIKCNFKELR